MSIEEIVVPDIGDFGEVDIIEVLVAAGDVINAEDSLITLESDKASMEIPSPKGGTVSEVLVKVGDKVAQGAAIVKLDTDTAAETVTDSPAPESEPAAAEKAAPEPVAEPMPPGAARPSAPPVPPVDDHSVASGKAHASPSVRRFARELGADLSQIKGTGSKGRVLKTDVQAFVKNAMTRGGASGSGIAVIDMPDIDFSAFGDIETRPLTRIQKLSGANLHRNWVTIPHVTQFGEADITEMEEFRRSQKDKLAKEGVRLTVLSFLMKGLVVVLKEFPNFNASLAPDGENLVIKKHFHIGIAVDTPNGLVVPVVRNVDQKGLFELAGELGDISQKARDKKLTPDDLKGGTFSISSLGGIGGTAFTPIINAPEVAILGVSRSAMQPVYNDGEFVPRLILPLSLSYDHRVIDGADGARFIAKLGEVFSDIREMLL